MTLPDVLEVTPVDMPVDATVVVPGSKSITNRALLIAALAEGRSELTGALYSDDTRYMATALNELGIEVESDEGSCRFVVEGQGGTDTLDFNGAGGVTRLRELLSELAAHIGNAWRESQQSSPVHTLRNTLVRKEAKCRANRRQVFVAPAGILEDSGERRSRRCPVDC